MLPDEDLLDVQAENAEVYLDEMATRFESGAMTRVAHVHAYAALFRQRGVCNMLATGDCEPVFIAQQQAASAYLHRLPNLPEEEKVTSLADVFWDAVAGEYWSAAEAIARNSRATFNAKREYEEDFLYVWFVMQRFFLGGSQEDQSALLERWETVLDGAFDARLDLCSALLEARKDDALEALTAVGDSRAESVERKIDSGALEPEIALWFRPYWNEGLALIRLLAREGIEVPAVFPQVPDLLRVACPFAFDANAWRQVNLQPPRTR